MRAEVAFEPLTALAGGILGGVGVALAAWLYVTRSDRKQLSNHLNRGATA